MFKKILIICSLGIIFTACETRNAHAGHGHGEGEYSDQSMAEEAAAYADHEKLIYYTCPVPEHKHIHHAEKGKCEDCGAVLVPGVITSENDKEYYGCPMLIHSHIRQDEPGNCAECGMRLMPMRLVKS